MAMINLLDVASRAMSVYQDAMSITGQNISNANTTDYSKQSVIFASDVTVAGTGNGVKIADIERVRNTLIDTQVQTYQSALSDSTKRSDSLDRKSVV